MRVADPAAAGMDLEAMLPSRTVLSAATLRMYLKQQICPAWTHDLAPGESLAQSKRT
jgi:hypothetical protein